jgi:phosphonoacetaldehyde hydrolase
MTASGPRIRLVVFDWAGTTVDHGCFAPVAPFIEALNRHGVEISAAQARGPMGLEKRDHLRALLQLPEVQGRWRVMHGREPDERDVDAIFADFVPLQAEVLEQHSTLIDGVLDCAARLRDRGVAIGTTTGYFAGAAERVYRVAAEQGYHPDCNVHPGEVPAGRPAPWMIFRIMETLEIYPTSSVLKVGDTAPDIAEALSAGTWACGVTATGSLLGLTADELARLVPAERERRLTEAGDELFAAGAHYVAESVAAVPELLDEIDKRLAAGEIPSRATVAS